MNELQKKRILQPLIHLTSQDPNLTFLQREKHSFDYDNNTKSFTYIFKNYVPDYPMYRYFAIGNIKIEIHDKYGKLFQHENLSTLTVQIKNNPCENCTISEESLGQNLKTLIGDYLFPLYLLGGGFTWNQLCLEISRLNLLVDDPENYQISIHYDRYFHNKITRESELPIRAYLINPNYDNALMFGEGIFCSKFTEVCK